MLTWSGICRESCLDRINPLSALGLREKGFQRFSYAYSSVQGKIALSAEDRQCARWPLGRESEVGMSDEEVLVFRGGFPT